LSALSISALPLVKQRLNRQITDTSLDTYLAPLIESAELELIRKGVILQDDVDDIMLLVDYAVWRYKNRDEPGGMPQWLSLRIRERWLSPKGRDAVDT
jgi:hypothetical protein